MSRTERLAPDTAGIARAAAILRQGGLVAMPTETVYGLAGDATNADAVAAIYAAKGRPAFNPLIAHLPDHAAAAAHGVFNDDASRLAASFWPGPLTLVVPGRADSTIAPLARAGLDTVALRVPAHRIAIALIEAVGRPLAAPSANRSGHVSPTSAAHVLADLDGRIAAVIDGGETSVGIESTIVACLCDRPALLRPGGVAREAIEAVIGRPLAAARLEAADRPLAPGRLASHYAPRARLRLDAVDVRPGEAWLGFGDVVPAGLARARLARTLSASGDAAEAAARLYGLLREIDSHGVDMIAVAPIPSGGLGEAIRDRLARAAAPR